MRSNLLNLDLNLLVVFAALIEDRNVTRVSTKLNRTQSSVSHSLARLRDALDDELFVRTPGGMVPTPYAASLAKPIQDALRSIETAIEGCRVFDPRASERTFVLAINNQAAVSCAPLLARAAAAAPKVTLDMRPSGTLDIAERLDLGVIDLAVGGFATPGERFRDHHLFDDDFVVVCRKGHAADEPNMSLEALAASPHLILSSTGDDYSFVEEALIQLGYRRHVALYAPLLAARDILESSDMVAVVSRRTAQVIVHTTSLAVRALPIASPTLQTRMLWHRRWDDDAGHRWLRELVATSADTCRAMAEGHHQPPRLT